ncbi:MAG: SulP family inorganic anion transporter [Proteobacteria bacterium]|nr:MAG: SulP family inorganic anion transporter [Pseudomonadota bacterium]QKK10383.1 MAG: SulP family inorganic anion transporter [Pseudomonadota bacterium]
MFTAGRQISCPLWLYRLLPMLRWWPMVTPDSARRDLTAGLTGAIVVLPQGVAFATIAGMPPEYGLYAGMIPAIIAALWGSSWHLVSGPTTAASIVLLSSLSVHAQPGTAEYVQLALMLTFMVGVIELALGLARMGALVNFISHSVVVGFTAGAALLIAAKQIKNFTGDPQAQGEHVYDILYHFGQHIDEINIYVTAVGLVTLTAGILFKKFLPRFPYMIAALLIGSLTAVVLNLFFGGQAATQIQTVGALPRSLPPLSSPDFDLSDIKKLAPTALAVTLFALTEAVSIGRSLAMRSNQSLDGNQEFIGQGLSNIFGSFFSGYVATGSFNRSGVNYQAGAQTPLAAVFAGLLLIVIVLLVAPLVAYLPNAAMAGILFLVAWGLIDFQAIKHILKASREETVILVSTFLAVIFLELEFAIYLGVLMSLVLYLNRTSKPRIVARTPNANDRKRAFVTDSSLAECPQLKIIRIDGSLFFGSVSHVQECLRQIERASADQRHLLIIATGINFIDLSGADLLAREARRRKTRKGSLILSNVKPQVYEVLQKSGALAEIGPDKVFLSKADALATATAGVDWSACHQCDKRIFLECEANAQAGATSQPTTT